jgi:hypothetical protein
MSDKNTDSSSLAMNALNEVPTPNTDAQHITGLVKDSGHVTGYQLENGAILDKPDAVELAKQGGIAGVGISNRNGNEYLKSLPDETESNNLGNLPTIS